MKSGIVYLLAYISVVRLPYKFLSVTIIIKIHHFFLCIIGLSGGLSLVFFSSRVITVSATFFYYCSFYVKYILLFYSDSQMTGNGKKEIFFPEKYSLFIANEIINFYIQIFSLNGHEIFFYFHLNRLESKDA